MVVPRLAYWSVFGLALIGAGVFFLRSQTQPSESIEVLPATSTHITASNIINVDISGAVVHAGVYQLKPNARVAEALTLAGGLTAEADQDWIDQHLNRAQVLVDGQKLYIPAKSTLGTATSMKSDNEKIAINSATQAELETLPQVGPVTAQKIITNRPYTTIQDLVNKQVLSASVLVKIQELISLW